MKTRRMIEALYEALEYRFEDFYEFGHTEPKAVRWAGSVANEDIRRQANHRVQDRFALLLEHLGLEIQTVQAGERLVPRLPSRQVLASELVNPAPRPKRKAKAKR